MADKVEKQEKKLAPHVHLINGKETTIGHMIHLTDHAKRVHAGILRRIDPNTNEADIHVLDQNGTNRDEIRVPFSADGEPRSWNHLPA